MSKSPFESKDCINFIESFGVSESHVRKTVFMSYMHMNYTKSCLGVRNLGFSLSSEFPSIGGMSVRSSMVESMDAMPLSN